MKKKPNQKLTNALDPLYPRIVDPLLPLEKFVSAYKHNRPIPKWVVGWFAEAFEKYLDPDCKKRLDKLLGLNARAKRDRTERAVMQARDQFFLAQVFALHSMGVKLDSAIEAVATRKTGMTGKLRPTTAAYLRKIYFFYKKNYPGLFKHFDKEMSRCNKENLKAGYPHLKYGFKVT
jgi:hypothetical protein